MTARLVDKEWGSELTAALRADNSALRIICPFIKAGALGRLTHGKVPQAEIDCLDWPDLPPA